MKDPYQTQRKSSVKTVDPFEMKSFFDQITTLLVEGSQDGLKEEFPAVMTSLNGECTYITDFKKKRFY